MSWCEDDVQIINDVAIFYIDTTNIRDDAAEAFYCQLLLEYALHVTAQHTPCGNADTHTIAFHDHINGAPGDLMLSRSDSEAIKNVSHAGMVECSEIVCRMLVNSRESVGDKMLYLSYTSSNGLVAVHYGR